mgnify:CR=1 FL=1
MPAVSWLLDHCPPDYRGYAGWRRYPVALAWVATRHIEAQRWYATKGHPIKSARLVDQAVWELRELSWLLPILVVLLWRVEVPVKALLEKGAAENDCTLYQFLAAAVEAYTEQIVASLKETGRFSPIANATKTVNVYFHVITNTSGAGNITDARIADQIAVLNDAYAGLTGGVTYYYRVRAENSAGATVNHPDQYKIGTVGMPFPGTEVRIASDGEVQLKGPHLMAGYHNRDEATAEAMTEDGWLRTGDKGELDSDGYLRITGRIKELFKTSGGKYIAPPAIESKFKAICPYASQFMVFGNERNYVIALVTLDPDAMAGWAAENDMVGKSYTDLVRSDKVRSMIGDYVDELNSQLNRWETIKKWELLDHDLTVESGELTPSLKVKRGVVEKNNTDLIASFYS